VSTQAAQLDGWCGVVWRRRVYIGGRSGRARGRRRGVSGSGAAWWGPVSRREAGSGPASPPTSDPDRSRRGAPLGRSSSPWPRPSTQRPGRDRRCGSARDLLLLLGGGQHLVPRPAAFISCRITWDVTQSQRQRASGVQPSRADPDRQRRCVAAASPGDRRRSRRGAAAAGLLKNCWPPPAALVLLGMASAVRGGLIYAVGRWY